MWREALKFFKHLIDADSRESSMRFIAVHTSMIIIYAWALVSLLNREMADISGGVLTFAALALTGKVVQTVFGEQEKKERKYHDHDSED